ncbi:MAG: acetyl-CoA carboxylase biotin carboxyl carrier protein subunit [Anaerolineae bacterium]|nr:acetyl-CoA carboxylase biotin carboxyl carrier protein subunit [Anaerolineae bacterium]
MPNYRVTIDGRTYEVQVPDPGERPVRAIVDGRVFEVHTQPEVMTGPAPAVAEVKPGQMTERARPVPAVAVAAPPAATAPAPDGDGEVTAPLPGTIVSISVAAGDAIEYGQELCVLEAMKMNNPIRSTQAGQVTKILVSVGQRVQYGAPLMVIAGA